MKSLLLKNGSIAFDSDYQPKSVSADWIAVDVVLAGICETDLQLQKGYMGFEGIPGHEFVGVARSGRYAGQRVVGEINCACGQCGHCQNNRARHCSHRTVVGILNHDGAFAETVWLPEENLHPVPETVTNQQAVFTEPLAAACRVQEQVDIQPHDRIVVFGDGRLGHLCAAVLATLSDDVTVVGKHPWKLEQMAHLAVKPVQLDQFEPSQDADVVVDCTGSNSGFELSLKTVRSCGTVVLKTTVVDNQDVALSPIVIDEIRIVGSRCGPFPPALSLLESKTISVDSLISATYPLEDGEKAFQHAQRPDTLKVLLAIEE